MKTRSVLGGLLFTAVLGFTLVAPPTGAEAQDLGKKLGKDTDSVLSMMLAFVRDDVREVQEALKT